MVARLRVRVTGTVQGVGFRPYVFRLAQELGLAGFVLNDEHGVLLEAEGDEDALERLLTRLPAEAPPLAVVESMLPERLLVLEESGFQIRPTERSGQADALVSPDVATCDDCLTELFDHGDRRYRYPFVNCTACGPRFTIVRDVPYDRSLTTMAGFAMCAACQVEYHDPRDRRFHAQPNACPDCGPQLRLLDARGEPTLGAEDDDPVAGAVRALTTGRVLALKGLGGYHLACRADDEQAVARLRARKRREDKPFALMVASIDDARALVELTPADERLLRGRERPIAIAPLRAGAAVSASVAPGSDQLGVMLPATPLHHLLLADAATTLVMTSGNVSDEPIAYRDDDALERLGSIAQLFLVHDRPIQTRTDDSVVRSTGGGPLLLRRARGYVPASVDLPLAVPPLLACGAEFKSTFCVARGRRAWVSHHIGDLRTWETLRSYREGVEHFERLFAVDPLAVAHDLHPDYLSTTYALEREGVETIAVQHHHAHLAACLAEHAEHGPAVGAIFDGAGLGTDGTVWGGELLVGDLAGCERAGSLHPARLPGGDRAAREPWRMACAWLIEAGLEASDLPPGLAGRVDSAAWRAVGDLVRRGTAAPVTTSMGRLFDAVAALCGLRAVATFEGQAAMELEASADRTEQAAYELPLVTTAPDCDAPPVELDARLTLAAILADLDAGVPVATVAARFHNAVADATAAACTAIASERGLDLIVLSGGVFQNRLLLDRTRALLEREGLRVLVPERLPPNDGGISYGQAAVAAATLAARS